MWNELKEIFNDEFYRAVRTQLDREIEQKEDYAKKLESSQGSDVFKYFLLVNVAALESYVSQSRLQARSTFVLCRRVALFAFVVICSSVVLAIYSSTTGNNNYLEAAKLSAYSGVFTQFISGVFFYLYNKTLKQFNNAHERLITAQEVAISLVTAALISDSSKRDDCSIELSKQILAKSFSIVAQGTKA